MKMLNIKFLTIAIFLSTSSLIYSQTDSLNTFKLSDATIYYSIGSLENKRIVKEQKSMTSNLISITNVKKVRFISDSLIIVSNIKRSDFQLNPNKINSIRIRTGTYFGTGAGWGALSGIILGALIGYSAESGGNSSAPSYATGGGILLGIIIGPLVGGIIGGNIPYYENFPIHSNKDEFKRILYVNKK